MKKRYMLLIAGLTIGSAHWIGSSWLQDAAGFLDRRLIRPFETYIGAPALNALFYVQRYVVVYEAKALLKIAGGAQKNNPYSKTKAQVRMSKDIPAQEKAFITSRNQRIKTPQEQLLGVAFDQQTIPLRIAFCGSGGGYRAMIGSTGFMQGAQDIGLLPCITYFSALSGSTWSVFTWSAMGTQLDEFVTYLKRRANEGLTPIVKPAQLADITQAFLIKIAFKQYLTLVDVYGGLIANKLFEYFPNRHQVHLSQISKQLENGNWFMPIGTAINTNPYPYADWMEFTPYEIGSYVLGAFIPSWSYGRAFEKGNSRDYAPEQSLGFLLGTFGSAMEVAIPDVIDHAGDEIKSASSLLFDVMDALKTTRFGELRAAPAVVNNFAIGQGSNAIEKEKYLTLVDAGLHHNNPLPPLLRREREVDVIFVFDLSGGLQTDAPELLLAQDHARSLGLPFPVISPEQFKELGNKECTVFASNDPKTPWVIYMPLGIERDKFATTKFAYSTTDFNNLSGITRTHVTANKDLIIDALKRRLQQVNPGKYLQVEP